MATQETIRVSFGRQETLQVSYHVGDQDPAPEATNLQRKERIEPPLYYSVESKPLAPVLRRETVSVQSTIDGTPDGLDRY